MLETHLHVYKQRPHRRRRAHRSALAHQHQLDFPPHYIGISRPFHLPRNSI